VRPFGVRSAMPMARALVLAPDALVVPPRPDAYAAASAAVFAILESVTPLVEPLSLDEAFLDVTASVALFGAPAAIAAELRRRVAAEVGLAASAGIAAVKMVAKIASDVAKPNGQLEVPAAETRAFLAPLPVTRLWGVGPKTAEALRALGVSTIGDLAALGDGPLAAARLGVAGSELRALARGEDPRPVEPDRAAKSIGAEDTFDEDLRSLAALRVYVHAQALRVGERLRRAGVVARVVQLKLKLDDFSLGTRRVTLPAPTDDGQALYRAACELLDRSPPRRPVRLTGVSAQGLEPASPPPAAAAGTQLALFAAEVAPPGGPAPASPAGGAAPPPSPLPAARRARLNAALDRIGDRFGRHTITTADVAAARADADDGDPWRRR